jgi:hypothetical protein
VVTVRNAIIPAFVIVLFAVLVTGTRGDGSTEPQRSTTTTEQRNGPDIFGTNGVYCTLIAESPRRDTSGDRIAASGRFRCDRPGADQLGILVTLQRQGADGKWVNVTNGRFTAAGADTTRDRAEDQRSRTVTAPCTDGNYRTVVDGETASRDEDGAIVRKTFHNETRGTRNPCSRR